MSDGITVLRAALEWDALLPLIILLLWGLSRLFIKDRPADEEEGGRPAAPAESVEEVGRAQEIREEIRRRMQERQGRPHKAREREPARTFHDTSHTRPTPQAPPRRPHTGTGRPAWEAETGAGAGSRAFEKQLAEQLERVRESERTSRELLQRARGSQHSHDRAAAAASSAYDMRTRSTGGMHRDLKRALGTPYGARQAIVLSEILGPPVSRRRQHPALLEEL